MIYPELYGCYTVGLAIGDNAAADSGQTAPVLPPHQPRVQKLLMGNEGFYYERERVVVGDRYWVSDDYRDSISWGSHIRPGTGSESTFMAINGLPFYYSALVSGRMDACAIYIGPDFTPTIKPWAYTALAAKIVDISGTKKWRLWIFRVYTSDIFTLHMDVIKSVDFDLMDDVGDPPFDKLQWCSFGRGKEHCYLLAGFSNDDLALRLVRYQIDLSGLAEFDTIGVATSTLQTWLRSDADVTYSFNVVITQAGGPSHDDGTQEIVISESRSLSFADPAQTYTPVGRPYIAKDRLYYAAAKDVTAAIGSATTNYRGTGDAGPAQPISIWALAMSADRSLEYNQVIISVDILTAFAETEHKDLPTYLLTTHGETNSLLNWQDHFDGVDWVAAITGAAHYSASIENAYIGGIANNDIDLSSLLSRDVAEDYAWDHTVLADLESVVERTGSDVTLDLVSDNVVLETDTTAFVAEDLRVFGNSFIPEYESSNISAWQTSWGETGGSDSGGFSIIVIAPRFLGDYGRDYEISAANTDEAFVRIDSTSYAGAKCDPKATAFYDADLSVIHQEYDKVFCEILIDSVISINRYKSRLFKAFLNALSGVFDLTQTAIADSLNCFDVEGVDKNKKRLTALSIYTAFRPRINVPAWAAETRYRAGDWVIANDEFWNFFQNGNCPLPEFPPQYYIDRLDTDISLRVRRNGWFFFYRSTNSASLYPCSYWMAVDRGDTGIRESGTAEPDWEAAHEAGTFVVFDGNVLWLRIGTSFFKHFN